MGNGRLFELIESIGVGRQCCLLCFVVFLLFDVACMCLLLECVELFAKLFDLLLHAADGFEDAFVSAFEDGDILSGQADVGACI